MALLADAKSIPDEAYKTILELTFDVLLKRKSEDALLGKRHTPSNERPDFFVKRSCRSEGS
jgi:hypothetical protein